MHQQAPDTSSPDLLSHEELYTLPTDFAGFWLRLGAYLVDAIILRAGLWIVSAVTNLSSVDFFGDYSGTRQLGLWSAIALIEVLISVLYFSLLESSAWQATPGKRVFGIKVTNLMGNRLSFSQALGRMMGKFLSALILGIGFLMAAFTERKQALHDMVANTLVIKSNA